MMNIDNILGRLHVQRQQRNPRTEFVFVPHALYTELPVHNDGAAPTRVRKDRGSVLMTATDAKLTDDEIVDELLKAEQRLIVARSAEGDQRFVSDHNVWTYTRHGSTINWRADILLEPITPVAVAEIADVEEESSAVFVANHAPTTVSVSNTNSGEYIRAQTPSELFKNQRQYANSSGTPLLLDHTHPVVARVQQLVDKHRVARQDVTLLKSAPRGQEHWLNTEPVFVVELDVTMSLSTVTDMLLAHENKFYADLQNNEQHPLITNNSTLKFEHTTFVYCATFDSELRVFLWHAFCTEKDDTYDLCELQAQKLNANVLVQNEELLDRAFAKDSNLCLAELSVQHTHVDKLSDVDPIPYEKLTSALQQFDDAHPGTTRTTVRWHVTYRTSEFVIWTARFYYDMDTDVANREVHVNRLFNERMKVAGFVSSTLLPDNAFVYRLSITLSYNTVYDIARRLFVEARNRFYDAGVATHSDIQWQFDDNEWTANVLYLKVKK